MQFQTIKDVLVFWRESHSAMPLTWFAKRVGVSSSTLQRIFDGTTKVPDYSTARSICLNGMNNPNEAFQMLKTLYPENSAIISLDAKNFLDVQHFKDASLLSAYNDFYKWQLLNLFSISPVSATKLDELGKPYVNKAKELVADGLVEFADSVFRNKNPLGWIVTSDLLVKTVGYISRSLTEKSERGEADRNSQINFLLAGFNDQGKEEVRKLILECAEKISKVQQNKEYNGDKPVSIMMTMSDLI